MNNSTRSLQTLISAKPWLAFATSLLLCGALTASTSPQLVSDKLQPLPPGSVKLDGHVGHKIEQCIENRIKVQQIEKMLGLFVTRTNDTGGFKGEFIGKWLAAAALACRYQPNPDLQNSMLKTTEVFRKPLSTDGYISSYQPGAEFKTWDVWIQKYVLLGLLAQYDQTGDAATLEAAKRTADYVLQHTGPGKLSIEEYGPAVHRGSCNFNILEPIALLYQRTGEKRYLDFATYIIEAWSKPGKYATNGLRLIEKAQAGVPLVQSDALHCYALMACFEGLCESYRATGKHQYLDASLKFAQLILRDELMIIGSMSNQELWCNGAIEQTEMLEKPVETCATATWIKFCHQLLRLTGDSQWADQMEIALYNALLGAMMPKGEWWAYDSALIGERVPSYQQGIELSCCVSSGPRGLLITPQWAYMSSPKNGLFINLYSEGNATFELPKGKKVQVLQSTEYPATSLVTLTIQPEEPVRFALNLRVPQWSKQTVLKVNGEPLRCKPGSYAKIDRTWQPNDKVTLELDLRGRIIRAPSGAPQQAIMRGPLVLALDNRLTPPEDTTVWVLANPLNYEKIGAPSHSKGYVLAEHNFPPPGKDAYIDLKPIASKSTNVWMAFEVPCLVRPSHFYAHRTKNLVMCDFASAGNQWCETNLYRVWLPQPMFMGNLYPKNTWKIMNGSKRPTVPEYITRAVSNR